MPSSPRGSVGWGLVGTSVSPASRTPRPGRLPSTTVSTDWGRSRSAPTKTVSPNHWNICHLLFFIDKTPSLGLFDKKG